MTFVDDFNDLFDEYKSKKKSQSKSNNLSQVGVTVVDQLPIWKEVKVKAHYTQCLICRKNMDDEDLVEACDICSTYFHYRHIREWIKIKAKCPNCKS
ncbi:MAG: hypothetical protein OEZ01_15730 [Candidatus Heimdallarchaeota archaeon]|nr:hypothetical protein [Candidatus Heimdallarchaeota archaeon]MDH5647460.1 hypothetical protein [Candidatus Heimdallarchaeota archaeon]